MTIVFQRIAGLAAVVLLVAVSYLGIDAALSPPADSYEVTAVLGVAGSGLRAGSDVKARGVVVGQVADLRLEGGRAVATLLIFDHHPLPSADRLELVVTAKTVLGEKQVELLPHGRIEPPYLAPGDVIVTDPERYPTELQDVLAAIQPVLDAIDPRELAAIIDTLAAFDRQDAEVAARNIELAAELAAFGARTADDQLDRLAALADVAEALAPRMDDFNRLGRTLPRWVSLLPDRQLDVRSNLDALAVFSVGLAEFLEVNERTIHELLVFGDVVGAVVEPRADQISRMIHGIYRYSYGFGHHGGNLDDGTEHAWFKVLLGNEGEFARFCEEVPEPLREHAPGCRTRNDG